MRRMWVERDGRLLPHDGPVEQAVWVDLHDPTAEESAPLRALGVDVPTLDDMEEIEISNRLYREGGLDYLTVVIPTHTREDAPFSAPVAFVLGPDRLVTIRHHRPRPFETYPARADKTGPGCARPEQIFLGLLEEIVGRLADLLEGAGKALDEVTHSVFLPERRANTPRELQSSLEKVGRQSGRVAHVRLSLLTLERALAFFQSNLSDHPEREGLRDAVTALFTDIRALAVHGDYLSNRVAQATDATLGMINLAQNTTVRIVSVVAVLFLPPTLIASVYGMNFAAMPELAHPLGYPAALGLMVASAAVTWAVFKWKGWL